MPPVSHLSLAVTPIVLFILLLNKSVSFQKAVFWLTLHNNKPLETWLSTHASDIILMDFGTHKVQVGYFLKDSFFGIDVETLKSLRRHFTEINFLFKLFKTVR